jgi:superfamily II DNA or RNA helicase
VAGTTDILLATTIIESGLDIPRANTIFIDEADGYGLADLHQLRGRVGRSSTWRDPLTGCEGRSRRPNSMVISFTHTTEIDWMLPVLKPTGKKDSPAKESPVNGTSARVSGLMSDL